MKRYKVAVVGATGAVGQEMISILREREFPFSEVRPMASDRSAGTAINIGRQKARVIETNRQAFEDIDIALFSAGSEVSAHFAPAAVEAGAVVIDNSAAFRMDPEVPLVVPEVNPRDAAQHRGIIANPNCSTIQMVVALYPIHLKAKITRIIVDTYQSVSGTGAAAIKELNSQALAILRGTEVTSHVYPHQIAFNVLPEIDVFLDNGYTKEEWKMVTETRKIMHKPELLISATAVLVPVFVGHSEAIHLTTEVKITAEEARAILSNAPGVEVLDDPSVSLYPMPWSFAGKDTVGVGRIREDVSQENGLALWVVADNLRKGAALNAVQIAELLIENNWLKPVSQKAVIEVQK